MTQFDPQIGEVLVGLEEGRDEVVFVDLLLEAWKYDSRHTGLPRTESKCAWPRFQAEPGDEIPEAVRVLDLSDAQFLAVDRAIVKLPPALHRMIRVEYGMRAPQSARARHLNLSRLDYRSRLLAAQWGVYTALMPDVERWRDLIRSRVGQAMSGRVSRIA